MRRILIATAMLASALATAAQSLPSKNDAADLVAKAEQQMQLTGPGATPFHILAKIRYTVGSASLDGAYELLWESADRYREEFRLGALSSTYLALQDKLYIRRNTPTLTYPQWRARMLMGFPGHKYDVSKPDVLKVYKSQVGSEDLICADVKFSGTRCFSATTGEIVSSEIKSTLGKPPIAGLSEDGFVALGEARFPGHILSTMGDDSLEVRLDKVELVTHFADVTFAPPEGASAHEWCAQPQLGKQVGDPQFPLLVLPDGQPFHGPPVVGPQVASRRFSALYVQTGTDGHIEKMMETYPDGSAKDLTNKTVRQMRRAVHSCDGKPIEYEEVLGTAAVIDPNTKYVPLVVRDSGP
jgi:hypothetical protein